ncbi:hypothetical protein A2755_01565 [Candidatus Wolfebacteria bacterium RIFCSPHIGHO2_01_FULL_48_22]|uniref:EfeO-type cupredoxin-like domain-containing protein n=2 Tax=Candidatus Wolfeibacteriota TaxID=1752735 RepID=A0A1F8DQI7_9BACT|nr:MAG: hypothetical protein A2755_01565 [Candidatus Wolfebacteria bacterium RIFCSPHIGHO2_01_FULL_48_22]OGM91925.1 MAG: hypothetical protein A2935_02205 [Candidatus Wolfebacteria bacterium RIFCSPLOWO2_01_FULL_47_17b]
MKTLITVLIVVIIAAAVWLFLQPQQQSVTISPSESTVREFTVEGSPFKFVPNEIRVQQGDTVRIVFNNVQGTHDFVLDAFNVRTEIIQGGESQTIEFVADQNDKFEYYCSIGNHRAMGMVGTLTVE